MKIRSFSHRMLVVSLLAGLLCNPVLAQPQPDRLPPRQPRPAPEGLRPQPMSQPPGIETILTGEQRESLRRAMQAGRKKNQALQEQIRTARQALLQHAFAAESTEATLREHAQALAKLEAELQVIRLRAISEVEPALAPEQVEKILALPASLALLPQRQLRQPEGEFPPQRPPRNNRPETAPERPVRPAQP